MGLFLRVLKWAGLAVAACLLGAAAWVGTAYFKAGELLRAHPFHSVLVDGDESPALSTAEWTIFSASQGARIRGPDELCPAGAAGEQRCHLRDVTSWLGSRVYNRREHSGLIWPALVQYFIVLRIEGSAKPEALVRLYFDNCYLGQPQLGVDAAALELFGKVPANLSEEEAIAIGALIYFPNYRSAPDRWAEGQSKIRNRLESPE